MAMGENKHLRVDPCKSPSYDLLLNAGRVYSSCLCEISLRLKGLRGKTFFLKTSYNRPPGQWQYTGVIALSIYQPTTHVGITSLCIFPVSQSFMSVLILCDNSAYMMFCFLGHLYIGSYGW